MRTLGLILSMLWLFQAQALDVVDPSIAAAMSFEDDESWVTAPFEFIEGKKSDFGVLSTERKREDWIVPAQTPEDLIHGAKRSTLFVHEGKYALEWKDLGRFPTIACRNIPHDWSGSTGITLWVYSKVATKSIIQVGVLSDNEDTRYLDYLTTEFMVDWTGWKWLRIPQAQFTKKIGSPIGWDKVDALYFFAKAKGYEPDPRTELYLDALSMAKVDLADSSTKPADSKTPDVRIVPADVSSPNLNHRLPEVVTQLKDGEPEVQTSYFNGARGRYGYFPKYDPELASCDTKGGIYLRGKASIEILNEGGQWERLGFEQAINDLAKENAWEGVRVDHLPEERAVRVDGQGDLYVVEYVTETDASGKLKEKRALLMHSRDKGRHWKAYLLPLPWVDMEKVDCHNAECLKNPPVLTMTGHPFIPGTDRNLYLMLPEKKPDGTLFLPPKIKLSGPGFAAGPVHSGDGNFMVSHGGKIFVIYGKYANSEELTKRTLVIPKDHPAQSMEYKKQNNGPPKKASKGVATFVTAYDRRSKTLSAPVFVGYGGCDQDGHNWAAMTVDSKGILQVVINGHIDPLLYTSSVRPDDISRWTTPVYVPYRPDSKELTSVSYASINCDKNDNLLCVVRSEGGSYAYNHRLASLRKPAGKPWEKERSVVVPFSDMYHVWTHRVAYDLKNDRYFLSFFDQSGHMEQSRDAYFFYRFIWPSFEPKQNAGAPQEGKFGMYFNPPDEMTILMSENDGVSWTFAQTPDFLTPNVKPIVKPLVKPK